MTVESEKAGHHPGGASSSVHDLHGNAVATQADVTEQADDFLAGQDGRQAILVPGTDLRKDPPFLVLHEFDEEELRGGSRLADGLGLPVFDGFDVQDVIAQLRLGDRVWIGLAKLVDETHMAVVGVPGARGIEAQGKELGETPHRWIRMRVIIQRGALSEPREGAQSRRELLVTRLVGSIVLLFCLALTAVWGLIRLVVGVGIVVVAHKPRNHDRQPRNHPTFNLTPAPHLATCRAAA